MSGLAAGLARGLAMYGQGRMIADQREFERQQAEAEQQRRRAMDERQAAMMQAQLEQMQFQRTQAEAAAKRQQEADARDAYEGGYRRADDAARVGGAMQATGAGLGPMGNAVDAVAGYGRQMQQAAKAPAFTMGGTPMVKTGESLVERVQRLQAQQREGEAMQERAARAAERAEDRTFQAGENAKSRAATLAGIRERLAGAGGASQPPLPKTLPMGVEAAINENATVLSAIDQADAMFAKGKAVDGAFGRGMGIKRTLGLERWGATPEQQELAAVVGNVASQQIKLRSGAAVTASEWPRLRPFLPVLDGPGADDAATVRRKLQKMREIIAEETNARATYYEGQGYAVPAIPGRQKAAPNVNRDRPAGSPMDDPEFVQFLRSRGML